MKKQNESKWDGKRPDPITVVKESWYEKLLSWIPLTVKSLDIIIGVLFLILIAALVLGTLKGNGLL